MAAPDFSLVIACYNSERLLERGVARITEALDREKLSYELIFVDDKSEDRTAAVARALVAGHPGWRLLEHARNEGRGRTVADGIRAAKAPVVGSLDIDLATSPRYLPRLIAEVRAGADIASALRIQRPRRGTAFRWVLSKSYRALMRRALGCELQDTETGCKVFNRERILPVLDEIRDPRWFWDTEVMVRSQLKGARIVEVPTLFEPDGRYSTVRVLRDGALYLANLARFRRELLSLRTRSSSGPF